MTIQCIVDTLIELAAKWEKDAINGFNSAFDCVTDIEILVASILAKGGN